MGRQKQGHGAIAGRTCDGIDGRRSRKQKTGAGRSNCITGSVRCSWRSCRGDSCADCRSATKWNAETDFSRRTKFECGWSTSGCGKSASGGTEDATRRVCVSGVVAEIIRRGSGRIGFTSFINHAAGQPVARSRRNGIAVTMKMSILPNE